MALGKRVEGGGEEHAVLAQRRIIGLEGNLKDHPVHPPPPPSRICRS